jgi:hypothetical protein
VQKEKNADIFAEATPLKRKIAAKKVSRNFFMAD